jgi:hypothetical protein
MTKKTKEVRIDRGSVAKKGKATEAQGREKAGEALRAKSGRYIFTSPATSPNSVSTWSKAFKA